MDETLTKENLGSRSEDSSSSDLEDSLGDAANLERLSRLTNSKKDSWLQESGEARFPSFPKDFSISFGSATAVSEESQDLISTSDLLYPMQRVVVVGVQLKLESWPGTNISRPEFDNHSKELMDYAVSKLAKKGDLVVGLYSHKTGKKLPEGKSLTDLPRFMDSAISAWETLGEVNDIQVEARLKISDKAKSGFIEEAKNLSPYTILLSCSMKKYLQKQMFGIHKWSDYCIKEMPRHCTVIVVRHGNVITSAKGENRNSTLDKNPISLSRQESRCSTFTYEDVEKATNFFGNTQLARQTAASTNVYLGNFDGGSIACVRRYRGKNNLKDSEVDNIRSALFALQNKNSDFTVGIWNVIVNSKFCVIVTDYFPLGCLYDNLHGKKNSTMMTWSNRMKIISSIAKGLMFLHDCSPTVVHGCVHSANIVLDIGMGALVSNPLSPAVVLLLAPVTASLTQLNDYWTTAFHGESIKVLPYFGLPPGSFGNKGYLAPELEYQGAAIPACSVKGDVYAFGILLFEIVTGQLAYDDSRKPHSLFSSVRKLAVDKEYRELVDPRLFSSYEIDHVAILLDLALKCCDVEPDHRPKMEEVCDKLTFLEDECS